MRVATAEAERAPQFTLEELDQLDRIYDADPAAYMEDLLWIRPKRGGELAPLRLNPGQRKLHAAIQRQRAAGKPVRIIVLKARQIGFSTYIQGYDCYCLTRTRQLSSLAIAHKSDGSKNLLQMFLRYLDNLRPEWKPMVKSRNESLGYVVFDNPDVAARAQKPGLGSSLKVETAEDPQAGRSGTYQWVHASEVAFWPYPETFLALKQAVPNEPNTVFILESTANGATGSFYEMWKQAEAGEIDFEPIFVAWWEHEEYRLATTPAEEAAWQQYLEARGSGQEWDNILLNLDRDEADLAEVHPIDFGQIKWRRWAIRNLCENDVDKFRQEYPSSADEAFQVSGSPWFDIREVIRAKEQAKKGTPARRYTIDVDASKAQGRPVLVPDPFGELWVWEEPRPGEAYVLGADVAEGGEDGDADAAYVARVRDGIPVAELHGRFDTDIYAWRLHFLGLWYNTALLGPERNSLGVAVCNVLENYSRYPDLYWELSADDRELRPGWRTTVVTRPIIVSRLKEWVRDRVFPCPSIGFWEEALTFKRNAKGKPEHEQGKKDDRILAAAITLELREFAVARGQVPGPLAAVGTASYQDLLATGMPVLAADDEIDPAVLRTMPPWLRPGG